MSLLVRSKTRSGKDIDVNIEIDAGVTISGVQSPSHAIAIQNTSSTTSLLSAALSQFRSLSYF